MASIHFAILGAGPTGLDAALAAAERGFSFTLYEAAPTIAGHVAQWRHVRLFTPWDMNVSARMRRALSETGRELPATDACPTGGELIEHVFEPLAKLPSLRQGLALGTRVLSVGRRGLLKHEEIGNAVRADRPFRLLVEGPDGRERIEAADFVLDCTGNERANALGDGGIPAPGERHLTHRVHQQVPDVANDPTPWVGVTTLLIGAGHSAQTALRDLVHLAQDHSNTKIVWLLRGDGPRPDVDDPLPERRALADFAARVLEAPPAHVDIHRQSVVECLAETSPTSGEGRVEVTIRGQKDVLSTVEVDRILALTGRVGDHLLYRQLQVHECYATSGPMKLAAALMSASGDGGDCLTQSSQGPDTLRSPEPGFFILGSKSYGRRRDYLMRVGWQQVDEIFQLMG